MKLLSLFSGIGAFEKALYRLKVNYELVNFCEIDSYAAKSYCAIHNVDESKNLGDITKVDEKSLPKYIDLVTYGFPCQDISNSGKQKGFFNADGTQTRSGLFFESLRIIEETQPKVAIAENVKNLTSKKFKKQFQIVLESLEQAGYNNYWKVLNAKDYCVPQNRERVFIVSIRKDIDTDGFKFPEGFPLKLKLKDLLENEVDEKFYINTNSDTKLINKYFVVNKSGGGRETKIIVKEATKKGYAEATAGDSINIEHPNSKTRRGRVGKQVAQTLTTSCNQAVVEPKIKVIGNYSPSDYDTSEIVFEHCIATAVLENQGPGTATYTDLKVRKLTPKECFRLMDFDDCDFEKAESLNSNTKLYKQAGNSIVVSCLYYIFKSLIDKNILI